MALVVICGYPASGKSIFSAALAADLRERKRDVVVVNDDGLLSSENAENRPAAEKYASSEDEKVLRSRARAAAERSLDGRRIVILDAPNYVKGYRYELWCAARTHGVSHCVVHITADVDVCVSRDAGRTAAEAYGEALVRALVARFEPPNESNRWDSPLYTVDSNEINAGAQEVGEKVLGLVTGSAGGKRSLPRATRPQARPDADALGTIDRMTRGAESELVAAIRGGAGIGSRHTPTGATRGVLLTRVPRAAELRAMRRALLNVARMDPPSDLSDAAVLDGYVDYVNQQLKTGS